MPVTLTIDGRKVAVPEATTIWAAARRAGVEIPVLCHDPKLEPAGVCRMCAVEVEGARVLAAACVRAVEEGMVVRTASEKVERCRAMLTELMMADQPETSGKEATTGDDRLFELARRYEVRVRLPRGDGRPGDDSSPAIAVDHAACILCDRCIRACDDLQNNDVIGRTGKGYGARIAFDLDHPMGSSTCVTCGECVAACPTGALLNKDLHAPLRPREELKTVRSVCPYCGVGCAIDYHVDEQLNEIAYADGRDNPGSEGRLCVKGRYGYDYAMHPHRLQRPLIRREESYPKGPLSPEVASSETDGKRRRKPGGVVDYADVLPAFREATWDEALDLAARRLREIKEAHGAEALAGFGSAKCTNEEAYLFQKLVRAGFGTNNVDHCTRLCHASSVAALLETIGSGAVTAPFTEALNADVIMVIGANPTVNHPVAATFFKNAVREGRKLIVVDPRG
ncbi:MAG: molybdopterin-dependent oxidoreductase, partial [Planctomycetota bacterium]